MSFMPASGRASAARVFGPTIPSTTRPWLRWNAFTAARVFGPKIPSASMPSARCTFATAGPRLPIRRSSARTSAAAEPFARLCVPPETGSAAAIAATTSVTPALRACGIVLGSAAFRFQRARACETSQSSGSVRSRRVPGRRITGPSRSRSARETRLRGRSSSEASRARRRSERSRERSHSSLVPRSR